MFRFQLFNDINNRAEHDTLSPGSYPANIGPINSPLITRFTQLLSESSLHERASELAEGFQAINIAAMGGDKLAQEFLAFEYPSLDSENRFHVDSHIMAEKAFSEHSSPIGAYVLFQKFYDEDHFEKAINYLTLAIESENPDVRLALAVWLKPVTLPLSYRKDIKLLKLIGNCDAFRTFCTNHFYRKNPFYTPPRNAAFAPASKPKVKLGTIAGALGPDDGSQPLIQLTFLHYFLEKNYNKAWEALQEIITENNFVAESLLMVLANNNIFWFIEGENGYENENENNENTLIALLEFRTKIPDFNTYLQNTPLVSTFINEEHVKKRVALKQYQNAIYANDLEKAEGYLTVALSDYDLRVISSFLYTSSFLKEYHQQFSVGANLLKMLAEESNEKTAYFRFLDFFIAGDFTSAANCFSLASANNCPEIISSLILACIIYSLELGDRNNSMEPLLELTMHSPEFYQFVMTYKGYWPHLEQAVHEKNKKLIESEPWWGASLCL